MRPDLARAVRLEREVAGLREEQQVAAELGRLQSMFLDEGFGTLDEETLDTVASTLERLALDSDRMVGLITHVPALAERVPVRFVVSRDGSARPWSRSARDRLAVRCRVRIGIFDAYLASPRLPQAGHLALPVGP